MAAVRRAARYDVLLSDGEHVGLPLALAKRALGLRAAHVVIAHHLSTPRKARAFAMLNAQLGISALVVHSPRQRELAESMLGVARSRLEEVPYGVDPEFWQPQPAAEEPLIVAAGREHRDYSTLAAACVDLPVQVFIAGGSRFSPGSSWSAPATWPANFDCRQLDYQELRRTYARAQVVVMMAVSPQFATGTPACSFRLAIHWRLEKRSSACSKIRPNEPAWALTLVEPSRPAIRSRCTPGDWPGRLAWAPKTPTGRSSCRRRLQPASFGR